MLILWSVEAADVRLVIDLLLFEKQSPELYWEQIQVSEKKCQLVTT